MQAKSKINHFYFLQSSSIYTDTRSIHKSVVTTHQQQASQIKKINQPFFFLPYFEITNKFCKFITALQPTNNNAVLVVMVLGRYCQHFLQIPDTAISVVLPHQLRLQTDQLIILINWLTPTANVIIIFKKILKKKEMT